MDDLCVSTKTAMSLGLIVNEIATNAIKHGFSGKEEAVFSIKLEQDRKNGGYKLTLSNYGRPFPEEIDVKNTQTLGLRVISALTAQLDGTLDVQRAPHPVFTIRFHLAG
jgi:two-component sensor histidine kinase